MALAPGTVAGLVPWLLTGWHAGHWWPPVRALGLVPLLGGAAALVHAFARWYEEPVLSGRFGSEYERYHDAVPGWWPRPRPWRG